MKTLKLFTVVPAVLAMSLVFTNVTLAEAPLVVIKPNSQPEPLIVNGKSGGEKKSNCGNIAAAPNQVIQITDPLPYLRLTVESAGKPTLLIDGPGGRFCVLADSYSGGKPEISGYWQKGNYSIYVGELSQRQYNYSLSFSQQKK
ncbi:hypothetical protein PI95_026990 [Hassallia byssoidea VB512170]|uniref:Uncharacterized protein n=1 Tax=Hassallia byssoidea VB512170 TaxID=1304833 RepID=A0A846HEV8_9CYAN|nr:hypothetical protein [Hassalia byssoidea]NEU76097.1 hypothetical protein [Hassalia byssoidea VB512170]